MITRAIFLVLMLTVVQLAQGIAMRFELADPNIVTPLHIGLGVVTALMVVGLARSLRRQTHHVSADISFLLLLFMVQGIAGIFILADVETAAFIHLILSFFVVAAAANALVLSASGR
ncbi:MAG: hypothetical protein QW614_04250 [Candidatus Caldarchaeum sp.]|uniref:Uncharacterized protein n=1 Tax=Caldiarchaeum subterraneum TaxID=311458 RepID=A0A7C5L9D6_CALS0